MMNGVSMLQGTPHPSGITLLTRILDSARIPFVHADVFSLLPRSRGARVHLAVSLPPHGPCVGGDGGPMCQRLYWER